MQSYSDHLYPMMKHTYDDGSDLFQDDNVLIHLASLNALLSMKMIYNWNQLNTKGELGLFTTINNTPAEGISFKRLAFIPLVPFQRLCKSAMFLLFLWFMVAEHNNITFKLFFDN